jgi:hypothetical protein
MRFGFHIFNKKAYLPTCAITEAGFRLNVEPYEVCEISSAQDFGDALERMIKRGNPTVPTPRREDYGRPEVLDYAKVKSWKEFERKASYWHLSKADKWILEKWPRMKEGGWGGETSPLLEMSQSTNLKDLSGAVAKSVQQVEAGGLDNR